MTVRAEYVVDARKNVNLAQSLRELWTFREVVLAFAYRDVLVKYKQAVLGLAWVIIQPLAFLLIFTVVFGRLARVSGGGVPYAAFVLSTLVPWTFLQRAVSFGTHTLIADANLVRKVYFPREVPILGTVLSTGLDFAAGLGLLLLLGPVLGARLSWVIILAPLLWVALAVLAAGVSMILGALNVYYRDLNNVTPFLIQLWMYASPVVYPISTVPAPWRPYYVFLNPAAGILDGLRHILALGTLPDPATLGPSLAVTALLAWGGFAFFKRMEAGFADAI